MHRFWDIQIQKCRDLENRVMGASRSLEIAPLDRAHMTSYWCSTVTIGLSCTVSEINGDFRWISHENRQFSPPHVYLTPRWRGSPLNWVSARGQKKLEWWGYQVVEKVLRYWFSRFGTIPAYDGQPASQPRRRSKYALCISASRSKNLGNS